MINPKEELNEKTCNRLTNDELRDMCKAKGIQGYSQLNKNRLIPKCCMAPNLPMEQRFGWNEDETISKGIYVSDDRVALSGSREDFNQSRISFLLDAVTADYMDVHEIPGTNVLYTETRAGEKRVLNNRFYFNSFTNKFMLRSPFSDPDGEPCNDFFEKEYVEGAVDSLINPMIKGKCDYPLFALGSENMVMIAPWLNEFGKPDHSMTIGDYDTWNNLSKQDLADTIGNLVKKVKSDYKDISGDINKYEKDDFIRMAHILQEKLE